jgi:HD-like signal output (HDOD) protein
MFSPGPAEKNGDMSSATEGSGPVSYGRSTATISVAQTAPIRIHHLTENLCAEERAFRRWLPPTAAEALELCGRRSADAGAFEQVLARDPALAGQVISLAGAGLFAPRAPVLSVRDAAMHLGMESMRDVLLMIVSNGMALRAPGFETLGETMRRRALAAGIATRLCAKALRVESGHDFLVGLMHDIGEVVLMARCAEEGILTPGLIDDAVDGPIVRETIHNDHTRVGVVLARSWRLPAAVNEAVEFHHDYKAGRKARLAAHLAAAADVIASTVIAPSSSADPTRHPVLGELALPPAVVAGVVAEVAARLPAFVAAGSTAQQPREPSP